MSQKATYIEDKDILQALEQSPEGVVVEPGKVINGRVIAKEKGKILVDLGGVSTGIVSGRELSILFKLQKNQKSETKFLFLFLRMKTKKEWLFFLSEKLLK